VSPLTDRFVVSVVVPAYNSAALLPDAVESIRQQRYPRVELIVVDDGSTDRTAAIVRGISGLSVRYVYQPNGGPACARNHGLRLAQGEVIAFLDADDMWPPDRLRCQLRYLEEDPRTDVVLGRFQCFRRRPSADGGSEIEISSLVLVNLLLGAGLYRRRVFDRIGGFNEAMRFGEDWDWFMRAREHSVPIVAHDDVTLWYRQHESNMTRGLDGKEMNLLDVLKKSLDRRRAVRGEAYSMPRVFPFLDSVTPPRIPTEKG
jgi:glycosyltransferase involved in cell wall biosynthesis